MTNYNEYILCASIYVNDENEYVHQPFNIKKGFVVCGWRHHNCFAILSQIKTKKQLNNITIIQGFLTNKNRFVDRKESLQIASKNDQLITKHNPTTLLMSEDLY